MAENDNERDYSAIPTAVRDIFEALESELVWMHGRWNIYRQLFGTSSASNRRSSNGLIVRMSPPFHS